MEKNKKLMIFLGVLTTVVVGVVIYIRKSASTPVQLLDEADETDYTADTPQQSNLLDGNRLLKFGVNGAETKELQRLLGVVQDGIFGIKTQNMLLTKKGVKQITLNQWITTPNSNIVPASNTATVATHLYKKGDNLIVKNPNGATVSNYLSNFGNYQPENTSQHLQYNEIAGVVLQLFQDANKKPLYLVQQPGIFIDSILLVRESDIQKTTL